MSKAFPKKSVLWKGAILGGIVNATMTAQNPDYACYSHWAGNDYGLNGADGREGFVCFEGGPWAVEGRLVGVFFSAHSPRSPFHTETYDVEAFFQGCPPFQKSLAERVLHPAMELPVRGKEIACVTAVFWDEGDHLTAAGAWDEVMDNGVDLIENELIDDVELAYAAWQDAYGMSAEQVEFVRFLFQRKMAKPTVAFELTDAELRWLRSTFQDPKQKHLQIAHLMEMSRDKKQEKPIDLKWLDSIDREAVYRKAMKESREKFGAIGILVPELKSG
jgi:hypothetical protein